MKKSAYPATGFHQVITLRVLTVADLHQSRALGEGLLRAVRGHQPEWVACVGDVLDFSGRRGSQFSTPESAEFLAALPVKEMLFCQGNYEAENWPIFVEAWPPERRPPILLHGTARVVGPLAVVGFPCDTGWDGRDARRCRRRATSPPRTTPDPAGNR
jgi:hypothetical protein